MKCIISILIILTSYSVNYAQILLSDTSRSSRFQVYSNSRYNLPGFTFEKRIKSGIIDKPSIVYTEFQAPVLKKDFTALRSKTGIITPILEKGSFKILNHTWVGMNHFKYLSNSAQSDNFSFLNSLSLNNNIEAGFFKPGWYAKAFAGGGLHLSRSLDKDLPMGGSYSFGPHINLGVEVGKTIGKHLDLNLGLNSFYGLKLGAGYRF